MPKFDGAGRESMANEGSRPQKKPYEQPTVTKLTREEAKLKLMERARMGDEQAKELLDILFGEEKSRKENQQNCEAKNDTQGKKSA